ncbi:MAG: hypothetical protein D3926_00850 [Desulfobacteraceae bacterium]|nr:MAG: hypothetical protein D3926_00850 [Desulfobacteraceae bacterium]
MKNISDARKEKLEQDKAWDIISAAGKVYIGKGKKTLEYEPLEENKAEILSAALGRTGNLRAPTVQTGDAIYIGFNESIYDQG